jgi:hypothetical protein
VPSRRRHAWVGFAVCAILAILGLFVLDGVAAGATLLVTMLAFVGACIYALRDEDPDAAANTQRTGLIGWFGGWL